MTELKSNKKRKNDDESPELFWTKRWSAAHFSFWQRIGLGFRKSEWWLVLGTWILAFWAGYTLLEIHRASMLDQRAWVGVTELDVKVLKPESRFVYIAWMQNSGKTPAVDTRILFKYRTFMKDETPQFTYDSNENPVASFVMQPGMKISIAGKENPRDAPVTEAQASAMQSGITTLYIYGTIEYEDIFKRRHYTHVCAWVDRDLATTHPCNTYNDAN